MYSAASVRAIKDGILVARATAALPATTAQNLFTIAGGRILLLALVGEVTTIIQAQSTTVKVTSTPTTGSAIDMSSTGADINALEVGGHITLPATPASATALVKGLGGYIGLSAARLMVPPGVISVNYGAASTGAVKWDMAYVPYDDGATVTAA